MELVVKSAVQRRKDFQEWKERTSSEYQILVSPENLEELGSLATELSTIREANDSFSASLKSVKVRPISIGLSISLPKKSSIAMLAEGE
jgi:hypothetical protein